jgi:arabinoxylan arabinofuranohydrolase
MRNSVSAAFSCVPLVLFLIATCFADNPFVQTTYTADPHAIVYNGRVYVYAGNDSANATSGYVMRNWKCYSSSDMVNWTDHGVILLTRSISWSTGDANACQCIFRNGNFYFYFATGANTDNNLCSEGVAVATNPLGPFTDIGQPLIKGSLMTGCNATHGWRGLDPTVIIDDNGQAYLYWGNNVFYWVRLNSDMISYTGAITCLAQNDPAFGPDFEEGPFVHKRNSIYYLSYPSGFPECIAYTTSAGPTGPWTYKSVIMAAQSGTGSSSTIHQSIVDYAGNSYFFYHNGALPGGGNYKRSICVERFTYNANGTIPTITATTAGPPQVGNLNPYDTTQAETICWESGVRTEVCSEGGVDVDSVHNGDYIKVEGVNFGAGASSFIARVASNNTNGGNIELRLDSQTGTLVGTCAVVGTGGWQTWATRTCNVTGATGIHDLYLRFTGGSGLLFNFNWWKFNQTVGTVPGMGAKGENGNTIKVATGDGYIKLDFSQPVSPGKLNVCLFDVQGRLVTTLFDGQLSSPRLTFPLKGTEIRSGAYVIKISMKNTSTLTKILTF